MQGIVDKTALKKAAQEKAEQEKAALKRADQEKAEREANQEKAYKMVKNGLKDIKKALQDCDNAEHFHSIVTSYDSIDVRRSDVQEYLKVNPRSRSSLIELEKEIASLLIANRHIYGEKKPEPEVLTSPADKKVVVETAPKDEESAKSKTETTTKPQGPITTEPLEPVATKPLNPVTTEPLEPIATTPLDPVTTEPLEPVTAKSQDPVIDKSQEPVNPTIEEELQQKASQLRTVRETQLTEFTRYLKQLAAKREQFHKDYPKDPPENPNKIYGAMSLLVQSLEQSAESYKSGAINLDRFKADTTQTIRDKRDGVISEHRGCKQILINLLLAISTLGVGYLLGALLTRSFTPIKVNTDSANQLDDTQEAVNRLQS